MISLLLELRSSTKSSSKVWRRPLQLEPEARYLLFLQDWKSLLIEMGYFCHRNSTLTIEEMDVNFHRNEPLYKSSMRNLRGLIGKLQCVAGQTLPDISFGAIILAGVTVATATSVQCSEANKLTRRISLRNSSYFPQKCEF